MWEDNTTSLGYAIEVRNNRGQNTEEYTYTYTVQRDKRGQGGKIQRNILYTYTCTMYIAHCELKV